MRIYDIENINFKMENKKKMDIILLDVEKNKKKKKQIENLNYCGEGGYGVVYRCNFDNKDCVIKFSENENPLYLKKCYDYLKDGLDEFMLKIYYSGKLINNPEYEFYSIMQYGGDDLKKYDFDNEDNFKNSLFIIEQLINICIKIQEEKKMYTDFKLSNILLDDNNKISIIDIYIESNDLNNIKKCKFFKTNNVLDINICKMHKTKNYNYTYIYVLLMFVLINIICENNLKTICNKIIKKKKINTENSKFSDIIQLAFYSKFNLYDETINKHINELKGAIEFVNLNDIYDLFIDNIIIKELYKDIISKKLFVKILDNIIIPIPKKRNVKYLKKFYNIIKDYNGRD